MPNPSSIARGIAAATTCLLAAGLAAAAPAGAATHHRATTYLHTTRHHTVTAPAAIHPGIARIHNSGKDPVLIVGKKSAAGPYQLAREGSSKSGNAKRLFKDFVIRDEVSPHETVYLPLRRGTLYLVDANKLHVTAADVRTMHVTGRSSNAVVPASRPVSIAADNSLHSASTVPYHGTLHVMNHSDKVQFLLLVRISSTTPKAKLDDFAAHPTSSKLFALHITSFASVGVVSGHHGLWTTLAGARGHYGLLAFSFTGHYSSRARMLTVT